MGQLRRRALPEGTTLKTESVATRGTTNLSVPSVTFARSSFSDQERVAVTAGITNRGDAPLTAVPVTLSVDGRELQIEQVSVAAHASASVTFAPFTLAEANVSGAVRAGTDPLPADNTFYFSLAPTAPLAVLIVDGNDRGTSSLYLAKALGIGATPSFQITVTSVRRFTGRSLEKRAVVILNNTSFPPAATGGVLKLFVERGGGLLVVTGERTSWPASEADLLPGQIGPPVDRLSTRSGGTLGYLDYSHPVFEVFKAPRSGDFSSPRVFKYHALTVTPSSRVLARYDDGGVAAAEGNVGAGRVIVWTTTLDDTWTDLAVKPVYLPLVHQLTRYLARYEQATSWYTVGHVLDLSTYAAKIRGDRIVFTPSDQRVTASVNAPGLLELDEQGLYEVRSSGATTGRPEAIAVNLDPAEADLTPLDPEELVAAVTGRAADSQSPVATAVEMTREDAERRQGVWW